MAKLAVGETDPVAVPANRNPVVRVADVLAVTLVAAAGRIRVAMPPLEVAVAVRAPLKRMAFVSAAVRVTLHVTLAAARITVESAADTLTLAETLALYLAPTASAGEVVTEAVAEPASLIWFVRLALPTTDPATAPDSLMALSNDAVVVADIAGDPTNRI
jgi:hypothetical protein